MAQTSAKKKTLLIVAVVIVCLVIVAALVLPRLSSTDAKIAAGDKVVVTVTAASVEEMYGYQFRMNYDVAALEYVEAPASQVSKIDEIQSIFGKPQPGYALIGATMIGENPGISRKNFPVCQVIFTATKDTTLSELSITLSDVNIVKSDLSYIEGIEDWSIKAEVQAAAGV